MTVVPSHSSLWSRALFGVIEPARTACSAVIIGSGDALAAVGVDRLRGTARVVVRPLSARVPDSPLLAGVSLDAEGNPQLVLDAQELVAAAARIAMAVDTTPTAQTPILVVDDSLTTRMLEQSILESAGYLVDTAASGEEGLDVARRKTYSLILVDCRNAWHRWVHLRRTSPGRSSPTRHTRHPCDVAQRA